MLRGTGSDSLHSPRREGFKSISSGTEKTNRARSDELYTAFLVSLILLRIHMHRPSPVLLLLLSMDSFFPG